MFVIVEGPDNSGKSTLCDLISKETGVPVTHSGGPPKNDQEMNDRIKRLLDHPRPALFDRFPVISDRVYGYAMNRGTPVTDEHVRQLKIRAPTIIYCRPSISELLKFERDQSSKVYKSPEHIRGVESHIFALIGRYDEVISDYEHLHYDWTKASHQSNRLLIQWLRAYL